MLHMHKHSIDNTRLNNFNWAGRQLRLGGNWVSGKWQVEITKRDKPNTETAQ